MSLALHRKYRPRKISELDQENVRKFFEHILNTGQFGQSYLFTGPKGTGKTSGARILARLLNCQLNHQLLTKSLDNGSKEQLQEPCGSCENCLAIEKGNSPILIEMDAASNRGIDDIRLLREQIGFVPVGGAYTVYIIDEVHMLTTEAFNALLKTLEEPPTHAIFCLCTTELHKLPATIVSRCVQVEYHKSTNQEIIRSLNRVIKAEQLELSDEVLELIANRADCSFRDAVMLVSQLVGSTDLSITTVRSLLHETSTQQIDQLFDLILAGHASASLNLLDTFINQGINPKKVAQLLLEKSRQLLRSSLPNPDSRNYMELIEVLSKAFGRFADVPLPSLPLEMAIAEFCLKRAEPQPQVLAKPPTLPPKATRTKVVAATVKEDKTEVVLAAQVVDKVVEAAPEPQASLVSINLDQIKQQWAYIIAEVSKQNHGLVTLLQKANIHDCDGSQLTLSVGYSFHKQQLEQERYSRLIEDVLAQIFGGRVRLGIVLNDVPRTTKEFKLHENVTGQIPAEDQELVSAVEEVFGG